MIKNSPEHQAAVIYHQHLRPGKVNIYSAVAAGMIPKADLVDGVTYLGHCRNATEAVWDTGLQMFLYLRTKFGSTFDEAIPHPEDDLSYDVFVPISIKPQGEPQP